MTKSKATTKAKARKPAPKPKAKPKAKQPAQKAHRPAARVIQRRVATAPTKRPTASPVKIPAVGAPFQGGFYAGKFFGGDGRPYALIVAPKATGETEAKFKTDRSSNAAARSLRDGFANSQALNDDAHPAAKFCRGLKIGKYTDWYLPSRHEAALLAENLMPGGDYVPEQTSAKAFQEGGPEAFARSWYWTSTEFSSGYAWIQSFGSGNQSNFDEDWSCRVRAVRKCPL
jgi:hypothetical protein